MTARRRTGRARREQQRALLDYRDRIARPTPTPSQSPASQSKPVAPAPTTKKAAPASPSKPAPAKRAAKKVAPKPAPKPAPPQQQVQRPSGSSLQDRLTDREITLLLKTLVPPEEKRDGRRETF